MKKLFLLLFLMTISLGYSQGAAPTPPVRNATDVISVFSGAYTDVGSDFYPNWGQGTLYEQIALGGDTALHYTNLDYQGIQFNAPINGATMTKLHLDIWTPNISPFNFYLIAGGENAVTLTPTLSGWNSYDIDLATAYPLRTLNNMIQFKFEKPGFIYHGENNTIYLDNIYFWKPAPAAGTPTITNFTVPTKQIGNPAFTLTAPTSNSPGAFSYSSSNTSVATISGNTVTIVGVGSSTITATQAPASGFLSGSISTVFTVTPPAAPTPTVAAANVISIFSDAYTNVTGTDFFPNWGQSTVVSDISINGNLTKKMSNFNYQGTQFNPNNLNVSGMQTLHIDIWTPNCTTFELYLVNQPNPEQAVVLTPSLSGWNSFDIDLALYNNINLSNLGQFKYVGTNGSTVYLDNIYFSNVIVTQAPLLTGFSVPAKLIGDPAFTLTPPNSPSAGAFTYTSSNPSVATISGSTVTIIGTGTSIITATQAANGNYLTASTSANLIVSPAAPLVAAPTPPARNAWDTVSFFSNAYTDVAGTDFFPNWGQSTVVSDVTIAGNATKLMTDLNYQGVQFASPTNVSQMTKLHIDVWTPNCASFEVFLIGGGENNVVLTPTFAGWNSYDIDMSNYAARDLFNIIQFKFVGTPFGSSKVYYDNLYFWRPATTQPPTLGTFTVPAKLVGDPSFTLTAPTSNSVGAFTYSSSNPSVATVSGNIVTIITGGTTVITANQAAAGAYGIGSTFANLVVTFPPPMTAAPTPTVPAARVTSIFSGAYTDIAGTDFNPNWGQSTQVTEVLIDGNPTKLMNNLNYQGVQFTPQNLTGKTTLHIDVWTPNCSTFDVFLVSGSTGEQAVSLTPTLSGWNSYDIALSQYSNLSLTDIFQFKFVGTPFGGRIVYYDNVYFSDLAGINPAYTGAPIVVSPLNLCYQSVASPLTATLNYGVSLKWYTVATGGTASLVAPTPSTAYITSPTVLSKKYYVSQVFANNVEGPRALIEVVTKALSLTPGVITGIASQGALVGTTTTANYSIVPVVDATSYTWTVPAGVNIISGQGTTNLTIDFAGVSSGVGAIGNLSVKSVNALGCISAARTLALTKALPTAPASIKMTIGTSTTAISTFGQYIAQPTVLTLTALPSLTATSYVWELPAGVNQLSGGNTNVITVNFAGVARGTSLLRIGVKSLNGTGLSVTSNATLVPATTSTARLLTLTAAIPTAPTSLVLTNSAISTVTAVSNVSKYIGTTTPFTLTASTVATAYSYTWELPEGVTQLSGGISNVITIDFAGVPAGTTSLYLGVKAKNGIGVSETINTALVPATTSTAKLLKITAAVPAAPTTIKLTDDTISTITAVTNVSKYIGTTKPLTLTSAISLTANSYTWELPAGVNLLSGGTSNVITIDLAGVPVGTTSLYLGVKAINGVGASVSVNSALVPATTSTAKLLKVTGAVPAVVTVVTGQITSVCGNSSYNYTITPSIYANSYRITAPIGSVVTSASTTNSDETLTTSDLTFTVTYPSNLESLATKTLVITSVNGVGDSVTNKVLSIITTVATPVSITGLTLLNCGISVNQTYTTPLVIGATTYTWTVPAGVSIVSGQGTNTAVLSFTSLTTTTAIIKVKATNVCGVSSLEKTLTVSKGTCVFGKDISNDSEIIDSKLYPNPTSDNFNLDILSSKSSSISIEIYSYNGSIVSKKNYQLEEGENTINNDVSTLASGMYIVKIINSSTNTVEIKKFTKN